MTFVDRSRSLTLFKLVVRIVSPQWKDEAVRESECFFGTAANCEVRLWSRSLSVVISGRTYLLGITVKLGLGEVGAR